MHLTSCQAQKRHTTKYVVFSNLAIMVESSQRRPHNFAPLSFDEFAVYGTSHLQFST